ncbi:D-aminoacyl-tRNA deacylase [Enterococcus timonensis]|uniref:D-aminoacyl-tRNA deacylase n=1 Tax=Enterococcus timonensis TaxID=1852364 RepID=UPI0008DB1501|nr:D-aminoacyl-tRNA deacylase [Enterococcus timonensis]
MKIILQKVSRAKVVVEEKIVGEIGQGFLLYVGFTQADTVENAQKLAEKITKLRVFPDDQGKMNLSLAQVGGEILSVSQFTLYGNTKKGNRPSFTEALSGEEAEKLYTTFNEHLAKFFKVATGIFGADMQVSSLNDGPVTFILEN